MRCTAVACNFCGLGLFEAVGVWSGGRLVCLTFSKSKQGNLLCIQQNWLAHDLPALGVFIRVTNMPMPRTVSAPRAAPLQLEAGSSSAPASVRPLLFSTISGGPATLRSQLRAWSPACSARPKNATQGTSASLKFYCSMTASSIMLQQAAPHNRGARALHVQAACRPAGLRHRTARLMTAISSLCRTSFIVGKAMAAQPRQSTTQHTEHGAAC